MKSELTDEAVSTSTSRVKKPLPEGMHSITPHIVCAGAADAIEFYKKAFNAVAVYFKTPEFQVLAARKYVDRQSRIAPPIDGSVLANRFQVPP